MHLVGTYCRDTSRCKVNKTLNISPIIVVVLPRPTYHLELLSCQRGQHITHNGCRVTEASILPRTFVVLPRPSYHLEFLSCCRGQHITQNCCVTEAYISTRIIVLLPRPNHLEFLSCYRGQHITYKCCRVFEANTSPRTVWTVKSIRP